MTTPVATERSETVAGEQSFSRRSHRWRRWRAHLIRVVVALVSIWGVSTIVFIITRATGNPVRLMLPPGAPASQLAATTKFFGLNRPLIDQYFTFLKGLVHLDFGISYYSQTSARSVVFGHIGTTLELAGLSFAVTLVIALPFAAIAAYHEAGRLDRVFTAVASLGIAVPQFWLGPLLIIVFAVKFRVLPVSGNDGILHYVLPVATLSALTIAVLFVVARAALWKELRSPYVDEARAKGLGPARLMISHIAPNAGLSLLTVGGLILANLIAGDILVENIFAWPGIGQLMIIAVGQFDFPVIQAIVLIYSVVFIGILFIVDSLYQLIDPRAEGVTA
jgi:peptide/nickel transport system permease protein